MLLTERDWQWWFGVSGQEATRLVRVQRALMSAGVDPCPETVLGMSRTVLADGLASQRLRALAELWDRTPLTSVAAEPGWPLEADGSALHRQCAHQTCGSHRPLVGRCRLPRHRGSSDA